MASAPLLFQETRISPPSPSPTSVLHIHTQPSSSSFGAGRKRAFDEISGLDEESYARKYLATEGSVFFRPISRAPRSFLWRVLNDRQVLELRCVDLRRQNKFPDSTSWLTFHVTFPAAINPAGVALADGQKDALEIFVITSNSELYTITLRRDLLLRETAPADFDPTTCVKKYSPGSFTYKKPYRLVAISSLELLISLQDGSLLRLNREANENGAQWRETHFSEGGWSGTLKRSFALPLYKQKTVRYGNIDLFQDAMVAMVKSPDNKHIWTVGLDHSLKAWSVETGKVLISSDLLKEDQDHDDRKKHGQFLMNPEEGTLLQIITPPLAETDDGQGVARQPDVYFLVVHSPKEHQFKIYKINRDPSSLMEGEELVIRDIKPRETLIPPIDEFMDTQVWHLEHFIVKPGPDWFASQLWIRARSGAVPKTFMLSFDLFGDHPKLAIGDAFRSGWSAVDASSQTIEQIKQSVDFSRLDLAVVAESTLSERWTDFLFYPGRFTESSLETALQIYRNGRSLTNPLSRGIRSNEEPLKERLTSSVAAKILLRRCPNEQPDYDMYQKDMQSQWNAFFSILSHLHKRRHDNVGFAFDMAEGLPWTVCADAVAPIRTCTKFELMAKNATLFFGNQFSKFPALSRRFASPMDEEEEEEDDSIESPLLNAQIMTLARRLRTCLSAASNDKLKSLAVLSALEDGAEGSAETALELIYNECSFQDEIKDDEFDAISEIASAFDSLSSLTLDHLLMVVESSHDELGQKGRDLGDHLEPYGLYMSAIVVQETLERTQAVLLDVLALVVFMHCDFEPDEMSPDFRPYELHDAILRRLRNTELRLWLSGHVRRRTSSSSGRLGELATLYESIFLPDWSAKPGTENVQFFQPEILTGWAKNWAFGLDLTDWGGVTAHILADLLVHKEIDHALGFEKYLTETAWICYLRGRLHLVTGDYALASFFFRAAEGEMATGGCPKNNLLSDEEQNFFKRGPTLYFQHVSSLFERLKAFSYTADFALLALAHVDEAKLEAELAILDGKKSIKDSPASQRISASLDEIRILRTRTARDELLNRRLNALTQTGHFERAYETLRQIKNPQFQKTGLQQVLKACIDRDAVSTLLELPIAGDFVSEADAILLALAKRNMASGLPSGPQYHQILFAFRTKNSDFRGAAAILYEHMEHLQKTKKMAMLDPEDETLIKIYVLLINTLACCSEDECWLLADPIPGVHVVDRKRKLVTLEDIRRDYAAELDRRSDVLQGRFPLVAGDDEMDIF